nr:hypothetical protein [uncultured Mucilaginibacter sp.]
MISYKMKLGAGVMAIIYIAVQTFQWWVYNRVPETGNAITDFLNGGNSLHVWRSWLMLLSMFGLLYIFFVVCAEAFSRNKGLAALAFLGFFMFALLEVALRSVELFYVQLNLTTAYATADGAGKQAIMGTVGIMQGVQSALYFPLMFGTLLGSIALVCVFRKWPGAGRIILLAFLINACRLVLRILAAYFNTGIFIGDMLNNQLYLPLVVVTFGLKAWWLFKIAAEQKAAGEALA